MRKKQAIVLLNLPESQGEAKYSSQLFRETFCMPKMEGATKVLSVGPDPFV